MKTIFYFLLMVAGSIGIAILFEKQKQHKALQLPAQPALQTKELATLPVTTLP